MKRQFLILSGLFFVIGFLMPVFASAQTVNTIQDINFGEAVILDNSAQFSIEVDSNGSFTIDPAFGVVSTPTEGEYLVTGLPALTPIISINVTVDQQLLGPGEDFTIDNFDINAPAISDVNGELPITLGARLRTSGTGINYLPANSFSSMMTITVNY